VRERRDTPQGHGDEQKDETARVRLTGQVSEREGAEARESETDEGGGDPEDPRAAAKI